MSKDISRQTLFILVILTIFISLLGTYTVLKETADITVVRLPAEQSTPSSQGIVSLDLTDGPSEPVVSDSSGIVSISLQGE